MICLRGFEFPPTWVHIVPARLLVTPATPPSYSFSVFEGSFTVSTRKELLADLPVFTNRTRFGRVVVHNSS